MGCIVEEQNTSKPPIIIKENLYIINSSNEFELIFEQSPTISIYVLVCIHNLLHFLPFPTGKHIKEYKFFFSFLLLQAKGTKRTYPQGTVPKKLKLHPLLRHMRCRYTQWPSASRQKFEFLNK